jgi:hypothetical protein
MSRRVARGRAVVCAAACAIACATACGKAAPAGSTGTAGTSSAEGDGPGAANAPSPMDAREAAQWAAAAQGEAEELMRLEDLVGCEGLVDRGAQHDLRATAIRAMQYCPDFSELPWLVQWASDGSPVEARAALETIDELAARPRRATDPEDADELHVGCAALLDLARSESRPRERRVLAARALRMLADRGCVRPADIPQIVNGK